MGEPVNSQDETDPTRLAAILNGLREGFQIIDPEWTWSTSTHALVRDSRAADQRRDLCDLCGYFFVAVQPLGDVPRIVLPSTRPLYFVPPAVKVI